MSYVNYISINLEKNLTTTPTTTTKHRESLLEHRLLDLTLRDSDSVNWEFTFFNKSLVDIDDPGPETVLWEPLCQSNIFHFILKVLILADAKFNHALQIISNPLFYYIFKILKIAFIRELSPHSSMRNLACSLFHEIFHEIFRVHDDQDTLSWECPTLFKNMTKYSDPPQKKK